MAQQASIIDEGVDRFNAAYESLEGEVQRLQKEFQGRRKSIEKRTRKQEKQLRTDLRKSPLIRRAKRYSRSWWRSNRSASRSSLDSVVSAGRGMVRLSPIYNL